MAIPASPSRQPRGHGRAGGGPFLMIRWLKGALYEEPGDGQEPTSMKCFASTSNEKDKEKEITQT